MKRHSRARKTARNQIAASKAVVSEGDKHMILRPSKANRPDEVRLKLARFGLNHKDVKAAISWVRKSS